ARTPRRCSGVAGPERTSLPRPSNRARLPYPSQAYRSCFWWPLLERSYDAATKRDDACTGDCAGFKRTYRVMGESDKVFKTRYLSGGESTFAPKADLADKHNYSTHVFIERDGRVSEVVRLNVLDDRHREDIIGF